MRVVERIAKVSPRTGYCLCVAAVIALGLGLRADALGGTLLADDYDHYAMRAGIYPLARGALDSFNFVSGDPAERTVLLEAGRLPWWSAPDLELSVLRPLASALVWFDYGALRGAPLLLHLHSLAWWVLLVVAVALVLREVLPWPIAALALLLYALDAAHSLPMAWIANRSALCAIGLVMLGLFVHMRQRLHGLRFGRLLAALLVGLGLLAGEYAIAPLAYFACFELAFMRDAFGKRLRALAPVFLLAAAYLMAHRALGYGLAGSGFYVDPIAAPERYLRLAELRVPLLLGDGLLGIGADWQFAGVPFRDWLVDRGVFPKTWLDPTRLAELQRWLGYAAGALALAAVALCSRAGARERPELRAVGFLLLSSVLSVLPQAGTLPMSRLLLAPAVGFSAALALLIWTAIDRARRHGKPLARSAAALLALALVSVHGVHAARRAWLDARYYSLLSTLEEDWVSRAEIDDSQVALQDVFVITAADWASQWAISALRHRKGKPRPHTAQLMSAAIQRKHVLSRPGPRLLDIEIVDGPQIGSFAGSVYRSEELLFEGGEHRALSHFQVLVKEAKDGQPVRLRFRFERPVDDPRYLFLYPFRDGLKRVQPPAIGEKLELPLPAAPHPPRR